MTEADKPRGLRVLISNGVAIAQTRLELLAVEAQEERLRIAEILFNTILAALFIGFGCLLFAVFFTVWLWDSHRLWMLGIFTVLFLLGGWLTASRAASAVRQGSRLFAASLAELARDRDALAQRGDTTLGR